MDISSDLSDIFVECIRALNNEIEAAQEKGKSALYLFDGELLKASEGEWIYRFTADEEVFIPDDSPATLIISGRKIDCTVNGSEGFYIFVSSLEDLGEWVKEAELEKDLAYLIKALRDSIPNRLSKVPKDSPVLAETLGLIKSNYKGALKNFPKTPLFRELNPIQQEVVRKVWQHRCCFVWGPPGTGKTHTIAALVETFLAADKTVLITSHTNVAVDNAILKVIEAPGAKLFLEFGKIVRLGIPRLPQLQEDELVSMKSIAARKNPNLLEKKKRLESDLRQTREKRRNLTGTGELSETEKRKIREVDLQLSQIKKELRPVYKQLESSESTIIDEALVLGMTLSKLAISKNFAERFWDFVIVDEASMAWIPQILFAAMHTFAHIVVVGDFRQLAPISFAETPWAQKWLQKDIFAQAGVIEAVNRGNVPENLMRLSIQYRMHPTIATIPNTLIYNKMLKNGPNVKGERKRITNYEPFSGKAVVGVAIDSLNAVCYRETLPPGTTWNKMSRSRYNFLSAAISVLLASIAKENYSRPNADEPLPIAIITPYIAQAKLLNRMIQDMGFKEWVIASTVHRFQGSEADIVIFDCPDARPRKSPGILIREGFGSPAMRLINVAVTRARGKFILVGDLGYLKEQLSESDTLAHLITYLRSSAHIEEASLVSLPSPMSSSKGIFTGQDIEARFRKVLSEASRIDVVLSSDSDPFPMIRKAIPNDAKLRIFTNQKNQKEIRGFSKQIEVEISPLKWYPPTTAVLVDETFGFWEKLRLGSRSWSPSYYMYMPLTIKWWLSMLEKGTLIKGDISEAVNNWFDEECPTHKIRMQVRKSKDQRLFLGCPAFYTQGCKYIVSLEPENFTTRLSNCACPKCKAMGLTVRKGPYGWYVGCDKWDNCKWTSKIDFILRLSPDQLSSSGEERDEDETD